MEEERYQRARREAHERSAERDAELLERRRERERRLEALGPDEAQRIVSTAETSPDAVFLGSQQTPTEWYEACRVARQTVIAAAESRRTVTYGEIKWAVFHELEALVGHSQFANLVMSINRRSDGALLSAIVVKKDTGEPGDGFLPYAREQGYDAPLEILQRQVWEAFRG